MVDMTLVSDAACVRRVAGRRLSGHWRRKVIAPRQLVQAAAASLGLSERQTGQNERNAQKFTVVPLSPSAPSKIAT